MSQTTILAIVIGGSWAAGVLCVVFWVRNRRLSLAERVQPYLGTRTRPESRIHADVVVNAGRWGQVFLPVIAQSQRLLEQFGPSATNISQRLERAGQPRTLSQHRSQQLITSLAGGVGGLMLGVVLAATRSSSLVVMIVLTVIGAAVGLLLHDQSLSREVKRRQSQITMELPAVAELLALAVAAGDSPSNAIERLAPQIHGELAAEFRTVVADMRAGQPLTRALDSLAVRCDVPALTRAAEAVAVATERGTPLAHVLTDQAQDIREAGRQQLMESGARSEVLMLVPVVFLVLPVTVAFAIVPSLFTLQVGL